MYFINNIPFSDFGLVPGRASNSNIAISGCWDMPERIGKTHHVWEESNEIEPYLRADEIFFGGRDINVFCWLNELDRPRFIEKIQSFYTVVDDLQNGLFPLRCPLGEWMVQIVDAQPVNYLNKGYGNIQLKFRQPVVEMGGSLPVTSSGGVGIDGYSFGDLSLVKKLTKNQADRASSRKLETVSYSREAIGRVRRQSREFTLDFFIDQPSYPAFKACVGNFAYLLSRPNARTLRLDDNTTREVFAKDGFQVSNVRVATNRVTAFLSVRFTEIRMLENWNLLVDNGGLVLVDKYGQPLTEILKRF
ncbi:hypothetical protein [Sphingobacterium sp. 1.A.4]|uniref:hypothetical protein n=1 Tax=Sphingobacterium sp. 1.A.4 TaxID=2044603 RepID=UPI000C0BF25C|nr:hypothetical protein [Sphingobacterium sp. 1.A.4]